MVVEHHEVRFEKNPVNKMFRARCTCKWSGFSYDLTDLQGAAASHAVGWEPVTPQPEPAPAVAS